MNRWFFALVLVVVTWTAAMLVPTDSKSPQRSVYAQEPTATAECVGECRALRHEVLTSGGDFSRFEFKGDFDVAPLPCVKDIWGARAEASHPLSITGPRMNTSTSTSTGNHRIEIGYIKTNWTTPSAFLYTYCSFCDSGIRKWKFVKRVNNIVFPINVRIVVNDDTPQSIDWFFTESGGSEQTANSVTSSSLNLRFVPDKIYAGGYTSDSRSELGAHQVEDFQFKIGAGSFTNWSPSPGHGWQEYYRKRYITQWLAPRLLVFSDVHMAGSPPRVCP